MRARSSSVQAAVRVFVPGLVSAWVVGLGGCAHQRPQDPVRSEISLPDEPLKSLTVELYASVGDVSVKGGCDELVVGTVDYDAAAATPDISFERRDGHGRLVLRPSPERASHAGGFDWELCVTATHPLYLRLDAGVGDAELDLRQTQLRRLSLDAHVGDVVVKLPTPDPTVTRKIVEVRVDAGVGDVNIEAPSSAPTRVRVDDGVGDVDVEGLGRVGPGMWTNDAWGKDVEPRVEIAAARGVGDLRVRAVSPEP